VVAVEHQLDVGPDVELMLDGYHNYSRTDALRIGRALEKLGFAWFEEMMNEQSSASYAWLAGQLDIPIVGPASLSGKHYSRADWVKVVKVWDRVAKFVKDEKNLEEAAKIMSARVGLSPELYKPLMKGTHIMDLAEAKTRWSKTENLESVFGSSKIVDDFNVKNKVYKEAMKVDDYLDPSLAEEAMK
jgi:hypothetical protein